MLPDRNIQPDEYEALLEAINERLNGALDRGAWQWSQAFYLPSCPEENRGGALFEHNEGSPLPVSESVHRGRELVAAREHRNPLSELGEILQTFARMQGSLEDIARVKAMLSFIDLDVLRPEWRQTGRGVMAAGWDCAPQLIREWSEKGVKFNETDTISG
jgi:hypothetical protein